MYTFPAVWLLRAFSRVTGHISAARALTMVWFQCLNLHLYSTVVAFMVNVICLSLSLDVAWSEWKQIDLIDPIFQNLYIPLIILSNQLLSSLILST